MAINLEWYRCKEVGWCDLFKVNIENPLIQETEGVYVCWTGTLIDDSLNVLKIGYGYIYDCIESLRKDREFDPFHGRGVFISWASCATYRMNGIQNYLVNELQPLFKSDIIKGSSKIKVNFPFEDDELDSLKNQLESN